MTTESWDYSKCQNYEMNQNYDIKSWNDMEMKGQLWEKKSWHLKN